jgi:hypothetical protein
LQGLAWPWMGTRGNSASRSRVGRAITREWPPSSHRLALTLTVRVRVRVRVRVGVRVRVRVRVRSGLTCAMMQATRAWCRVLTLSPALTLTLIHHRAARRVSAGALGAAMAGRARARPTAAGATGTGAWARGGRARHGAGHRGRVRCPHRCHRRVRVPQQAQSAPWAVRPGQCPGSFPGPPHGAPWRLWAARRSPGDMHLRMHMCMCMCMCMYMCMHMSPRQASPPGAQPLPRVRERAASEAADAHRFHPPPLAVQAPPACGPPTSNRARSPLPPPTRPRTGWPPRSIPCGKTSRSQP